jgi:hypothetical protein
MMTDLKLHGSLHSVAAVFGHREKDKRIMAMNLLTCPKCGGINIAIDEHLDLLREWIQDENGVGGLLDFEEESYPCDRYLDLKCMSCRHAWKSEEFTRMEDFIGETYGEVTY